MTVILYKSSLYKHDLAPQFRVISGLNYIFSIRHFCMIFITVFTAPQTLIFFFHWSLICLFFFPLLQLCVTCIRWEPSSSFPETLLLVSSPKNGVFSCINRDTWPNIHTYQVQTSYLCGVIGRRSSSASSRAVWWRITPSDLPLSSCSNTRSFATSPMRGRFASSSKTTSTELRRRGVRKVSPEMRSVGMRAEELWGLPAFFSLKHSFKVLV